MSDHDFPAGIISDNIVVFQTGDGAEVAVALDPQFSALLCVCLMSRVHPDAFMAAAAKVNTEGISITPTHPIPPSLEGTQWARNRQERRHGRQPGQ